MSAPTIAAQSLAPGGDDGHPCLVTETRKEAGDPLGVTGLLIAPDGSMTRVTVSVERAGEDLAALVDAPGIAFQVGADGTHTAWFQDDDPNSYLPSELEDLRFDERPNIVGKHLAGLDRTPFGNVVIVGGKPGAPWTNVNLDVLGVTLTE